jgi:hypothetical protein
MYQYRIIRNGVEVIRRKRKRDLLVWRGLSVLADLISQGALGSDTSAWKVVVSGNETSPNMGDDSGVPLSTEFNPSLGTPSLVSWYFYPEDKVDGNAQVIATLTLTGTVEILTGGTIHKLGVIDSNVSHQNIIVEDATNGLDTVVVGDLVEVTYFMQLG